MVTLSNYRIEYAPPRDNKIGVSGFYVHLNPRFVTFCKVQEIDEVRIQLNAKEILKDVGYSKNLVDTFSDVCTFEGGLLKSVTIPENSCGLNYTSGIYSPMLYPHNVDNSQQMMALLGIFSSWSRTIERKIDLAPARLETQVLHAVRLEEILDKVCAFITSQHPSADKRKSMTDWINELWDRARDGPVKPLYTQVRDYLGFNYPGKKEAQLENKRGDE